MFGLFRKRHDPAKLVADLQYPYTLVSKAISSVGKPIAYPFECGVFINAFAMYGVFASGNPKAGALADEFNSLWLDHVVDKSKVNGISLSRAHFVKALQDHWRTYGEMLTAAIDSPNGMQTLALELWWNGTGTRQTTGTLRVMMVAGPVMEAALKSVRSAKDWAGE